MTVATCATASFRPMQDHTKLVVWQRARSLTVAINEACRAIRRGDAPGLRAQLMRAAMSISSTVAEGAGRDTRPDFARFVSMAISSASEVEHHLTVCGDLGVIDSVIAERLIDRVVDLRKMLFGLRRALIDKDVQERAVRGPPRVQRTQD